MMKHIDDLEAKARSQFSSGLKQDIRFRDTAFVTSWIEASREIALESTLPKEQLDIIALTIWIAACRWNLSEAQFKDYLKHETISYLAESDLRSSQIDNITSTVDSFEHGRPQTEFEKIVHDGYNAQMAGKGFWANVGKLRIEEEERKRAEFSDLEWYDYISRFLAKSTFRTSVAEEKYSQGISENQAQATKLIKKLQKKQDEMLEREMGVNEAQLKEMKKKLSKIEHRPERGVETMFRLTSSNHFGLNSTVDGKSNILISINSIILSIIIGTLFKSIDDDPHLFVPIIMLMTTNLASIIFAILAVRPALTHGKASFESQERKGTNLLFFGNFHHMNVDEYEMAMTNMMNDADQLYSSLSRDIFYLGRNLNKKFNLIRISFNIFMFGLTASVLTFVVCHIFFGEMDPSSVGIPFLGI